MTEVTELDRCTVCDRVHCEWWRNVVDGRRAIGGQASDECRSCAVNWRARALAAEATRDLLSANNAELGSVLDWALDALEGRLTSDFAESFPVVLRAVDLRAERDLFARMLDEEREATLVLKRRVEVLETLMEADADA